MTDETEPTPTPIEFYWVIIRDTGVLIKLTKNAAIRMLQVGDADFEWSIEEHGRCDTERFTAILAEYVAKDAGSEAP